MLGWRGISKRSREPRLVRWQMVDQRALSQTNLMAKFDFTPDDLEANRHGYMSKRQRFRLRWKSRIRVAIYTVIAMLFVGVVCYFLLIAAGGGNGTTRSTALGIGCFSIYLLVVAIASTVNAWRVRRDLRESRVSNIIGNIVFALASGSKSSNTWYGWARERRLYSPPINLELPWRAENAFEDGKIYRIFFAPYSKVVLSVECISEDGSEQPETA